MRNNSIVRLIFLNQKPYGARPFQWRASCGQLLLVIDRPKLKVDRRRIAIVTAAALGLFFRIGLSEIDLKALLQAADEPRRGALDGRGNLTAAGLAAFSQFFLETCLDQIVFMRELLRPVELMRRIEIWTEEEVAARRLPKGAWRLLREAILVGEFARSAAEELTGYQERQARTVLAGLTARGLLVSETPKGAVRLGIPAEVTERWFPGLYQPEPGF